MDGNYIFTTEGHPLPVLSDWHERLPEAYIPSNWTFVKVTCLLLSVVLFDGSKFKGYQLLFGKFSIFVLAFSVTIMSSLTVIQQYMVGLRISWNHTWTCLNRKNLCFGGRFTKLLLVFSVEYSWAVGLPFYLTIDLLGGSVWQCFCLLLFFLYLCFW